MYADWSPPLHRRRRRGMRSRLQIVPGALAVCALAFLALAGSAVAGATPHPHTLIVQPGDTLWSVASSQYPANDVREEVDALRSANHLATSQLVAGQVIVLP